MSAPLNIPWEHIKPQYKWAAMDASGDIDVFEDKPDISGSGWWVKSCEGLGFSCLDALNIDTTSIDWRESLTQRPAA